MTWKQEDTARHRSSHPLAQGDKGPLAGALRGLLCLGSRVAAAGRLGDTGLERTVLARPARRSAEAFPTTEPACSHVLPPRRLCTGSWLAHNFPEPHLPCLKDENVVGRKTKQIKALRSAPTPTPAPCPLPPTGAGAELPTMVLHSHSQAPRARAHLRAGKRGSGRRVVLTGTTQRAGPRWSGAENATVTCRRPPARLRLGQGARPSARCCSRALLSPHTRTHHLLGG